MYRFIRHLQRHILRRIPILIILVAVPACGDDPVTTPTEITAPVTITETFTGTVDRNGATTHPFVTHGGTITATIAMLSPDSAAIIGLSLGTWNGAACQTVIANDRATQGVTVVATASSTGNVCIRVYDATGSFTQPTSYEVLVVHPPS
jgi:hypothetical protein